MAGRFSLEEFVKHPTVDQVNSCRKDELVEMADHFNIPVTKTMLKREIRDRLVGGLMEQGVITLSEPVRPASPLSTSAEAESGPCGETPSESGQVRQADERKKTPFTLPRYDPSPHSSTSNTEARLKVRLARLQLEAREREAQSQLQLQLEIRKAELQAETDRAVRLRQLELEAPGRSVPTGSGTSPLSTTSTHSPDLAFDISKHVSLVPVFRDNEVDSYFNVFERIAVALRWPPEVWTLLLQCKMHGRAQDAIAALPVEDSLDYETVKSAILRAYELVPEAYRQKFRAHKKTPTQTYVEFAREKGTLFDKWCAACRVSDFNSLRELILLEDFKKCLSERIVVYLNEQKVSTLSAAAVLADEYVLTHKSAFSPASAVAGVSSSPKLPSSRQREGRECYYCHQIGHVIANCATLKRKEQSPRSPQPKGVCLIKADCGDITDTSPQEIDDCFKPFVFDAFVSLTESANKLPIRALRDTACSQSVILASALPFSDDSACHYGSVLRGVEMGYVPRPVHRVHIQSSIATGVFPVAVCAELPIPGIVLLMGNDIAGGKVTPTLEVLDQHQGEGIQPPGQTPPNVFPACAVTRARARELASDREVSLSDSFFVSAVTDDEEEKDPESCAAPAQGASVDQAPPAGPELPLAGDTAFPANRARLSQMQKADPTLRECFAKVVSNSKARDEKVAYIVDGEILMRKWSSFATDDSDCDSVYQIVVPAGCRQQVMSVAHESKWAGHLGVNKTYQAILRYFYWPGLKSDVTKYCRACHVCQVAGKPNQTVPPAPLQPIPVVAEPFERVIIDCVGPLPRTKSGNQYLLTIMCAATRYPEAIPLRSITAKTVVKALLKFFSTFGLPREIQTDQGSNFKSGLFRQVLKSLSVHHVTSSAYHPQSQGALERWHQTLKSMLRKYCVEYEKQWDEGIPFVLFAARDAVQESIGFSSAQLVFGHTPRGPLKSLHDQILFCESAPRKHALDYVTQFHERLKRVNAFAKATLGRSQSKMKDCYDRFAVAREFEAGDQVLVLLPTPKPVFAAKFSGPYLIKKRISNTDYVLSTPDRRRKTRVCHINLLKRYQSCENQVSPAAPPSLVAKAETGLKVAALVVTESVGSPHGDDPQVPVSTHLTARLPNSEILGNLTSHLHHLTAKQQSDLELLIGRYECLFGDVPTRTSILKHDIDVKDARPIKQHPYRANQNKRQLMKQEVEYLLRNNLASVSSSPWSSPCLLETKADGSPRFITDFRKVNAVTVKDSYPLPRMEDCIDNLGTAKFVSKLDLLKGYWQVPLTDRAKEISAFVTPDHFCQYNVMAFGMCNAPATFQRLVNTVLSGVSNCNAYLDDLVIYTDTWEKHMRVLEQVFDRLAHATLTINLAKCEFGKATVVYLGQQVGQGQVRPVEAKVAIIRDLIFPSQPRVRRCAGFWEWPATTGVIAATFPALFPH